MIRRLLLLLFAIVAANCCYSQLAVGSWRHYPVFSTGVEKLVDTDNHVYLLSSGFLYSYDKKADELQTLDKSNILSDVSVTDINYNKNSHYLAITFESGNIDLLYDDGEIINVPVIKDATLTTSPVINAVTFDNDRMYVAANFGIVMFDDKRHEVIQSGIFNRNVDVVIPLESHLVIVTEGSHMTIPRSERINKLENFTAQLTVSPFWHYIKDDSLPNVYYAGIYGVLARMEINPATGAITRTNAGGLGNFSDAGFINGADKIFFANQSGVIRSVTKGASRIAYTNEATLPAELAGDFVSTSSDLSHTWLASSKGIAEYNLTGENMTLLHDRIKPQGASTVIMPVSFFPGPTSDVFFVSNLGRSNFRPGGQGEGTNLIQLADMYEDGKFISIAPDDVTAKMSGSINQQNKWGKYIVNPTRMVQDPDDPEKIFMGSGSEGVYVIKNGKQLGKFDGDNSILTNLGGWRVLDIDIDKAGNLWVGMHSTSDYLFVLPSAKRKADPSTVTAADWVNVTPEPFTTGKDLTMITCRKSDVVIVTVSMGSLEVIDTRGTYSNFNDDLHKYYESFTDQDGKTFSSGIYCLVEDLEGHVWAGTSEGIIEFTRPGQMMNADFRINRLKVPRNDGTNLADYLLEKEIVTDISVDSSNRKWVATKSSGVYLVSANGDEILDHFTTDNSMLPSNQINGVYVHPTSNSVFFSTPYGITEYSSTSAPARPDYSEVYAYPNPVTPDYTGWITITGLMNDSRIKICDSAMQVVCETRSEGGMATWDGCNFSGARCKSGVYYVLASTGSDNTDAAADVVAKILIVN